MLGEGAVKQVEVGFGYFAPGSCRDDPSQHVCHAVSRGAFRQRLSCLLAEGSDTWTSCRFHADLRTPFSVISDTLP